MRSLALTLLVGVAVSGCVTDTPDRLDLARTPTEHFQARAVEEPNELKLAVHPTGLSEAQTEALAGLVTAWREDEAGLITIQSPAGGPPSEASARMGQGVQAFLTRQGVPRDQIAYVGYDAVGQTGAPLKVSYIHYRAVVPKCGQSWINVAHSAANQPQPNFGCAVTANMAAQIANPADLNRPADLGPVDAQRRQVVLGKYRTGDNTSTVEDKQAKGTISDAVK